MNILAFDTATPLLSLAVETPAGRYFNARDIGLRHGELLAPLIGSLLEEAGITPPELDLIICSRGPGSFTGLRIGMAGAKGLSAGTGAAVVSIPLPDYLARPFLRLPHPVLALVDAKKGRFYGALYSRGVRSGEYFDLTPAEIKALPGEESQLYVTGPDAGLFLERLMPADRTRFFELPSGLSAAVELLEAGKEQYERLGADASSQGPLYIRKSEAEISLEARNGVER